VSQSEYRLASVSRWVLAVGLGLMLGVLARWLTPERAGGDHPKAPHDHLGTINTLTTENFCVQIEDSSISQSTAVNTIRNTLLDSSGWQEVGDTTPDFDPKEGRIAFAGGSTPCFSDPNRDNIEIEYYVRANTTTDPICGDPSDPPPPPGYSCAWFTNSYPDATSGHSEFRYGYARLVTSYIAGTVPLAHHTVSHETGHISGLCDGGTGPLAYEVGQGCQSNPKHFVCRTSVMHSFAYGCSNYEWPTSLDLASVAGLIPGGGGGGGGGGNKGAFGWF
jgi:hypothetical protein